MLQLIHQKRFEKDMKTLLKRNKDPKKIEEVILLLVQGKPLPLKIEITNLVANLRVVGSVILNLTGF